MRITERRNAISKNIDVVDNVLKLEVLRRTYSEIFSGYMHFDSIYDECLLREIVRFSDAVREGIKEGSVTIVCAGCGTSGRIGYMVAREMQGFLGRGDVCFEYLHAGGDEALLMSDELPEDDPNLGIDELRELVECDPARQYFFVGITCGLSARYVLGQIMYACKNSDVFPGVLLLGCNPIDQAPDSPNFYIDYFKENFSPKELISKCKNEYNLHVGSMIVGPEPVTGSSRMKGGSVTKIILEVLFADIMTNYQDFTKTYSQRISECRNNLFLYERTFLNTYENKECLANIVDITAEGLKKGHVYYFGAESMGIMGFIDSSEMFDTYGESLHSIRGFVKDGYDEIKGVRFKTGDIVRSKDLLFHFTYDDFIIELVPNLCSDDTIIFGINYETLPAEKESLLQIFDLCKNYNAKCCACIFVTANSFEKDEDLASLDVITYIKLPSEKILPGTTFLSEFSWKLVCNDITTSSCIEKGCVYQNLMINLGVCNEKLYDRTIGIIMDITNVSHETAEEALLKSIYQTDTPQYNETMTTRLQKASHLQKVVPTAIILASNLNLTHTQATEILSKTPVLRSVIE